MRKIKTPKGWQSADVYWHIPKKKKPIAYSTVAVNDLIVELAKDGCTVKELQEKINYNAEAKKVLDEYIKRGFGDWIAREHFNDWLNPKAKPYVSPYCKGSDDSEESV